MIRRRTLPPTLLRACFALLATSALSCGSTPPPQEPTPEPAPVAPPAPPPAPAPSATAKAPPGPWPSFERPPTPPEAAPDGSIANADSVVDGMGRDFKRCYDRELLESPVAAGAFRIRATIESAGNVESVVLLTQSGNLSAALLRCCANVVRSRWFARPQGGGATVELPLKFTPDPKPAP